MERRENGKTVRNNNGVVVVIDFLSEELQYNRGRVEI